MNSNVLFIGKFPNFSQAGKKWQPIFIDTKEARELTPEIIKKLKKAEVIVTRSGCLFTKEVLSQSPGLKLIIKAGAGKDLIDNDYCQAHDIQIRNTPGSNAQSVAELAVGLVVTLSRNIVKNHQAMMQGQWIRDQFVGSELYDKTVSIIGFGNIGRRTALIFKAMGCSIKVHDPTLKDEEKDFVALLGYTLENCENCAVKKSDVIILHPTYNPTSHHFINRKKISKMKPGVLLINLARGGVMDEEAALEGLRNGIIGGLAVDTWWEEPPKHNRFTEFDNVIMTPHIGANTKEALARTTDRALKLVDEYFSNKHAVTEQQ